MIETLLSTLAPHLCSSCGVVGQLLCDNCKSNIISQWRPICVLCGKLSRGGVCMSHHAFFDFAWILGRRSGVLQCLIGSFKFQHQRAGALLLAGMLHVAIPTLPAFVVVVPIPTSRPHIRQRGYDHCLLLAKRFGRLRRIPVRPILFRRHDAVQHKSSRQQRLAQARTAFMIDGTLDPAVTYILFDDIVTTGATLNQAARVMKEAGAQTVWVVAIARQPLD